MSFILGAKCEVAVMHTLNGQICFRFSCCISTQE